jgi:transcriptional regulator with XRE-family HTH domain
MGDRQLSLWEARLCQEPSGALVASERTARGWSQARLATILGVHQSSVSRLESGERVAAYDELATIARAFGLPVGRLLGASARSVRRHRQGGRRQSTKESAALAARIDELALLAEFIAREGSTRALGQARTGHQPLSARQAAVALAVIADAAR